MGEPVIIYGNSGTGKTRSTKDFGEDEIFYIKVLNKRVPFNKKFRYEMFCDDTEKIKKVLTRMVKKEPHPKTVVIDDVTFIMVNQFMANHRNKKGDTQYEMYNEIADSIFNLFTFTANELPDDIIIYFLLHEDTNDYGITKISTIGKLLDDKVKIERMVNICLRCVIKNKKHLFITQSTGNDISKSPEGMFETEIPNDLKFVDQTIRAFYGFEPNGAEAAELEDTAMDDEKEIA